MSWQAQWSWIIDNAASPQEHAAVMETRRQFGRDDPPPHASMVDAYHRIMESRRHAPLDGIAIEVPELTDLAVIVDAGPAGLASRRFGYPGRLTLHRAQLVTHSTGDGRRVGADEGSNTTIRATLAGIAIVRSARTRVFPLTETDAAAFAKIDAVGTHLGWPGTAQAERISRYWGLVERTDDGRYRLTPAGRKALNRHRTPNDQIMPSHPQAGVLAHAARQGRDLVDLERFDYSVVQQCITRQWILRAGQVAGTRRCSYRISELGRDALDRWRDIDRNDRPRRLVAMRLEKGMWVRLLVRARLPVTEAYVQVHDIVTAGKPVNDSNWTPEYEVWVVDEPGLTPYLYGGRTVYPGTTYEIRPSEAEAA